MKAWLVMLLGAAWCQAAVLEETFSSSPIGSGWRYFGEANLFQWNEQQGALDVTWDSRMGNSYFYRPLGTILSQQDDFSLAFDLFLHDIAIASDPLKPYTFQIALGLLGFKDATAPPFYRGSGMNAAHGPRNLVEFNYFPDSGFGATVAPTVVSTNNRIAFGDNHPLELGTGHWFHVTLNYTASDRVLRSAMTQDGMPFGMPPNQTLVDRPLGAYPDFRVDTLAIASYSDLGQSPPEFAGSILAHGRIDNVRLALPPGPLESVRFRPGPGPWEADVPSRIGWVYQLERTTDLRSWAAASTVSDGTGQTITLRDELPAEASSVFYRVKANRP